MNNLLSSVKRGCCWAQFWVMEHFQYFILTEACLSWEYSALSGVEDYVVRFMKTVIFQNLVFYFSVQHGGVGAWHYKKSQYYSIRCWNSQIQMIARKFFLIFYVSFFTQSNKNVLELIIDKCDLIIENARLQL